MQPSSAKYCLILSVMSVCATDLVYKPGYLLLVLEFEVFAEIIDVDCLVIDDKGCGCDVGHEIIDVPARHFGAPKKMLTPSLVTGESETLTPRGQTSV